MSIEPIDDVPTRKTIVGNTVGNLHALNDGSNRRKVLPV